MSESKKRTRREFIKTVRWRCGFGCDGRFCGPRHAIAKEKPIKFGQIMTTSGIMAGQGIPGMRSARIAEEIINKSGGILGRPLKIIQEDDELKPGVGVRKFRKLVLEDKVDFLFGTNSSGVGLALIPLANEFGKIFISTSMSDRFTEQDCSPYIFRIGESTSMASRASAYCMCETTRALGEKMGRHQSRLYLWPRILDMVQERNGGKGDKDRDSSRSFPTVWLSGFQTVYHRCPQSGAQGVFTSAWTGDLINFVKQAKPFGFFDKVKAFVNNTTAHADLYRAR